MYQLQSSHRAARKFFPALTGLVCALLVVCFTLIAIWNARPLAVLWRKTFPLVQLAQPTRRTSTLLSVVSISMPGAQAISTGDMPTLPPTPALMAVNAGQPSEFPPTPTPTWPPPPPTPTPNGGGPSVGFPSTPTPTITFAPGFTPEPTSPPPPPDCNGASIITGRVVLPNGQPASDVFVETRANASNLPHCGNPSVNEQGEFILRYLPAGTWTLQAHPLGLGSSPYIAYASQAISVTVDGVNPVNLAEPLRLSGPQVIGQVFFANGKPGANLAVGVFAQNASVCPGTAHPGFSVGAALDTTGHFQTGGLPAAGHYCVELMTNWNKQIAATLPFTLTDVAGTVDLGIITLATPPKHITGRIHDQAGNAVAGWVHVGRKAGETYTGDYIDTQADMTGTFAVDVDAGVWEVSVQPIGDEWQAIGTIYTETKQLVQFTNDASEENRSVAFVLTKPAAIAGRVLTPDGQPVTFTNGSLIFVATANQNDGSSNSRSLDAAGRFLIRVEPGLNWVRLFVQGNASYFPPPPRAVQVNGNLRVELGDIHLAGPQVTAKLIRANGEPVAAQFTVHPLTSGDSCPPNVNIAPTPTLMPGPPGIPVSGVVPTPTPMLDLTSGYPQKPDLAGLIDSQGAFQVGGLAKGDYCLNIIREWNMPDLASLDPIKFHIQDETSVTDLGTLTLPSPLKRIEGMVRNADDTARPNVNLMVSRPGNADHWTLNITSDVSGTFAVEVSGGDWMVRVLTPNQLSNVFLSSDIGQTIHFANDQTVESRHIEFVFYGVYLPLVNK